MTKMHMLAGVTACLTMATASPAETISLHFIPLSNTCPYPWVMTLQPAATAPKIRLTPGTSVVVSKNISGLETPHGLYAPVADRRVDRGHFCHFRRCNEASITLTCAEPGSGDFDLTFAFKGQAAR